MADLLFMKLIFQPVTGCAVDEMNAPKPDSNGDADALRQTKIQICLRFEIAVLEGCMRFIEIGLLQFTHAKENVVEFKDGCSFKPLPEFEGVKVAIIVGGAVDIDWLLYGLVALW